MELTLYRTYHPSGTNGSVYLNEVFLCHTIELPWLNNEQQRSCIPEGRYELHKRWSQKFGDHYLLLNVPGRACILIHPANNALKELKGCIAPVTLLTGEGKGTFSRMALKLLQCHIDEVIESEKIYLTINSSYKGKIETGNASVLSSRGTKDL
jgi:hypothetical protein